MTEELAERSLPKKKQLANRVFRQVTEEFAVGSLPRGNELANRGFRFRLSVVANRKSTQERAVAFLTNERKQLPNTAFCFSYDEGYSQ